MLIKKMSFKAVILSCGLAATFSLADAHHSFSATFQKNARITVDGTVTRVTFKNPHVLVYMDVTENDGSVRQWVAEGPSVVSMRRDGWVADTVGKGDKISVRGDSTHDGSPMVSLDEVNLLDANTGRPIKALRTLDHVGFVPVPAKFSELPQRLDNGLPNFMALWSARLPAQTEGALLPPVPYSAAGKARIALWDVRHDPQVFCDNPGLYRQIGQNPYPIKITQEDDRIIIDYEEYSGQRIIPIRDEVPPMGVKSRLGDSAARYEGDELIIETVNFLENPGTTRGDFISDEARIVERYRRGDDEVNGAVIEIDVIAYDPVYLAEPYIVSRRKSLIDGYSYTENQCEPPLRERQVFSPYTSFISLPSGLEPSDAQCEAVASDMGEGGKAWRVVAREHHTQFLNPDRIGNGPWYDSRGELVARNFAGLSDSITFRAEQGAVCFLSLIHI